MVRHWDGSPVQFGQTITYNCMPNRYFEESREQVTTTITCHEGGYYDMADVKLCFETVHCRIEDAPATPEGG